MNYIKRAFCAVLAIALLIPAFAITGYAAPIDRSSVLLYLPENVKNAVIHNMEIRDISTENAKVEIIYNREDCPAFLLGYSQGGYIILDSETLQFMECGEVNPYCLYENAKKYYDGPLCYHVELNGGYQGILDIVSNTCTDRNDYIRDSALETAAVSRERVQIGDGADASSLRSSVIGTPEVVFNAYSNIQRRAFGYNDDNTCSAVATCIALNYLALQSGKSIVPSGWISEKLTVKAGGKSDVAKYYKNAAALYNYMVNDCGMRPVSYGDAIKNAVRTYAKNKVPSSYNLTLNWTLAPRFTTIRNNIANNKPVLITTTLAGTYSVHTMVVYGWRQTTNGCELLVHTGWYCENTEDPANGHLYQPHTWITMDWATYGYYFSYN